MKNLDPHERFKIVMLMSGLLFAVLYAQIVLAWQVTPTLNTQKPEVIGQSTGELTGYIDMLYATGGVEWKQIKGKFKNIWVVDFENVRHLTCTYLLYYDRVSEKVRVDNVTWNKEVPDRTEITKCYFTVKGQR